MRRKDIRWCAAVAGFGFCLLGLGTRGADAPAEKEALRYDGKPFEYWRNYSRTELKAERRIDALRALAAFGVRGQPQSAATAIVEMVKEYNEDAYDGDEARATPDHKVILEALAAIIKIGPAAFEIVLQSAKDTHVRRFADFTRGNMSSKITILSPSAVRTLLRYVQGDEAEVRQFAVEMLGFAMKWNPSSEKNALAVLRTEKNQDRIVQGLIQTIEEGNTTLVNPILQALGSRAKPATAALVKARLRGDYIAEETFPAIGAETTELLREITKGLKSQKAEVKTRATEWLGEMGPKAKSALPVLLKELQDGSKRGNEKTRLAVITTLGCIGAEPQKVVPPLARLMSDDKEAREYRLAAAQALAELGSQAKEAAPVLLKVFANEEEQNEIRSGALQTLQLIGGEPHQVVPHLIHVIEQDMEVHPKGNWIDYHKLTGQALIYLVKLSPESKEAMPILIRAFKHYNHDEKLHPLIARALGQMGPAATDALPALREGMKSSNGEVRKAAALAIKKITAKE